MKYCMYFNQHSKYIDDVDELIIYYHPNESEVALIPFLDSRPEQIVTLQINDFEEEQEKEIIKMLEMAASRKNLKVSLNSGGRALGLVEPLLELEIPYFINDALFTIEQMYQYKGYGVTEVLLSGALGFQLDKVKYVADKLDLKTRINYNCGISGDPIDLQVMEPYWQFLIRPEDIDLYSEYLDTIIIPQVEPISFSDGIFKAYQEKKWNGKLNELFLFMPSDYDNKFIIPHWGQRRIKCDRRCMYKDNCHLCEVIKDLGNTLEKAEIIIPPDIRGAHVTAASEDPSDQSLESNAAAAAEPEKPKFIPAF